MKESADPAAAGAINIFVISWPGMHARAAQIAQALRIETARVSIVYSGGDGSDFAGTQARLIRRDDALFWADKFQACLDHAAPDETMLIIHADCRCADWPKLLRRCEAAFENIEGLGVWSPKTRGTPHRLEKTRMGRIAGSRYSLVGNTDGLVFALAPAVARRMRKIDYRDNLYGWGIDWAFVSFAHAHAMPVVVDESITVHHSISAGYSPASAKQQMIAFLREQLTPEEIDAYHRIWDHMQARKRWANLLYDFETWRGRWRRRIGKIIPRAGG